MELNRQAETPLCVQIADSLERDIVSGALAEHAKLPGERLLSRRFGTSRGTVIEALKLLEKRKRIRRVPAQGTFVRGATAADTRRILLPFPEREISPESLHGNLENWQISNEVRQGLLDYAGSAGNEVVFRYFPEDELPETTPEADGAVFIGWQLGALSRQLSQSGCGCVRIGTVDSDNPAELLVRNDIRSDISMLFRHLLTCGYRRFAVVVESDPFPVVELNVRAKLAALEYAFQCTPEAASLSAPKVFRFGETVSESEADSVIEFVESGKERCAVICLYTACLSLLHRMMTARGAMPRHGLTGYGTGILFLNLVPAVTYWKVGYREMGFEAGRLACEEAGTGTSAIRLISGELCLGETI